MRNRDIALLVVILLVSGLSLWINFAPDNNWLGRDVTTRLGLDLQGGTQVLLRAQSPDISSDTLQTARGVIERRVNGLGVSEAVVQTSGNDRIIVELPGVQNPDEAVETLRGTGRLEFINTNGQYLQTGETVRTTGNPNPTALIPTAVPTATGTLSSTADITATQVVTEATGTIYTSITDGRDLDTSAVQLRVGGSSAGNINNPYGVGFKFNEPSASQLAQFSAQSIGQPMCIVLDNVVFSCPQIQATLIGGQGEITTSTRDDAERIYNQLKYGALPVTLSVESSRTVSATLGQDSVTRSITAGIVGLLAVALFMILYYRLPGIVATLALLIYTAIIFAFYRLIPITLTLAGIAGFIRSIGLAVDANVLIFARLKEELRHGKSLHTAIEASFVESWPAIRDSNAATMITCIILYSFGNSFGVSIIKGFALTLGLGVIVSMFTAIVVTRTFLRLVGHLGIAQNLWLYMVDRSTPTSQSGQTTGV